MDRRTHLLALGASLGSLVLGTPAQARRARPGGPPAIDGPLQWITPAVEGPGLSFHTFRSRAAGTEVSFHVYAPPAYAAQPEIRLPVVYWLHGSGGGVSGVSPLAAVADAAIASGRAPPFLVVFVNGLRMGMYVDWSSGRAPLETIIVNELLPHVDANWRTLATRQGRLLDGFSMGGYGAARLGFGHPGLFGAVSLMGAGPLQESLEETPRASRLQAQDLLQRVYGGDEARFREVSPRRLAEGNAAVLARDTRLRMVIGDRDETLGNNRDFHDFLKGLGIPHDWIVLPGVGHDPMRVISALGDRHWAFYRAAFSSAGG